MAGLIHIYCGDGKGKTTAATGLAIRACGAGKKVVFAQFLKDGTSSEIRLLKKIGGTEVLYLPSHKGFYNTLCEEDKRQTKKEYREFFKNTIERAKKDCELLVLDEINAACGYGIIAEETILSFLRNKPDGLEVVLTGRNPPESFVRAADYVTEMKKIKHPYDAGIAARVGIEY